MRTTSIVCIGFGFWGRENPGIPSMYFLHFSVYGLLLKEGHLFVSSSAGLRSGCFCCLWLPTF